MNIIIKDGFKKHFNNNSLSDKMHLLPKKIIAKLNF